MNKNIYSKYMDTTFTEKIDNNMCDYLLKLNQDDMYNLIYDKTNIIDEQGLLSIKNYMKRVKNYLETMQSNNYQLNKKYKYSTHLKTCGRLYVIGFGIQSLQSKLRGALIPTTFDLDMKNAHPTLLKYLCENYFKDYEFPFLNSYVSNRESIIEEYKIDKRDVLIAMNCDKHIKTKNEFIKNIDREFKKIQQLIKEKNIFNVQSNSKDNPNGSILNIHLTILENNILQKGIEELKKNKYEINSLLFDGLAVYKNEKQNQVEDMIYILNKTSDEYNIKWVNKQHDKSITIDTDLIDNNPFHYEKVKIEFEKKHFLIKTPLNYAEEYYENNFKKIALYNKVNFKDLTSTYLIDGPNDKSVHIIEEWLRDKNKRVYRRIDFLPPPRHIDHDVYNSFFGLIGDNLKGTNVEFNKILNHLKILVDYDEKGYEYLINYLAHLIQKPGELPRVAILFKSNEGVGKNLFFNKFAEYFLNNEYYLETQKLDQITGRFNLIPKKLLICIDEVSGKDTFVKEEDIKSLITQEVVNWEQKNKEAILIQNCGRYIFFSNNDVPIKISLTDRRYVCFSCNNEYANNSEYFNELINELDNNDCMYSFYNFLKNKDISKFNLNDRPITKFYDELKEVNIPILVNFISDKFYRTTKKIVKVQASELYHEFKQYLDRFHKTMDYTATKFGRDLKKISGITKKRTNICVIYTIDIVVLKEYLELNNFIEDLEFDDFDINDSNDSDDSN